MANKKKEEISSVLNTRCIENALIFFCNNSLLKNCEKKLPFTSVDINALKLDCPFMATNLRYYIDIIFISWFVKRNTATEINQWLYCIAILIQ